MKVRELMASSVLTVSPTDPVDRVFYLIHFEKIRHLPVMDKKEVIGIVSDRDLYKTLGPSGRRQSVEKGKGGAKGQLYVIPREVRHIMKRGVLTIEPDADVAKASMMMARRKVGALPVVDNGRLVGIITATDVLLAFGRMSAELDKLRAKA